jgi:hypothetical protein
MGTRPELIYCAGGNPEFAALAVAAGWKYGARLPATVYQSVYFADQDWKRPDLCRYGRFRTDRPSYAAMLQRSKRALLPMTGDDGSDELSIACHCTD